MHAYCVLRLHNKTGVVVVKEVLNTMTLAGAVTIAVRAQPPGKAGNIFSLKN